MTKRDIRTAAPELATPRAATENGRWAAVVFYPQYTRPCQDCNMAKLQLREARDDNQPTH